MGLASKITPDGFRYEDKNWQHIRDASWPDSIPADNVIIDIGFSRGRGFRTVLAELLGSKVFRFIFNGVLNFVKIITLGAVDPVTVFGTDLLFRGEDALKKEFSKLINTAFDTYGKTKFLKNVIFPMYLDNKTNDKVKFSLQNNILGREGIDENWRFHYLIVFKRIIRFLRSEAKWLKEMSFDVNDQSKQTYVAGMTLLIFLNHPTTRHQEWFPKNLTVPEILVSEGFITWSKYLTGLSLDKKIADDDLEVLNDIFKVLSIWDITDDLDAVDSFYKENLDGRKDKTGKHGAIIAAALGGMAIIGK